MKLSLTQPNLAKIILTLLVVVLVSKNLMVLYTCQAANTLHPLILIPGSGGNQLEARLTGSYVPSSLLCNRWYPVTKTKDGWFRLWFDASVLLAPFTKCFAERMTLYYDPQTDDYYNAPGVETRVPHFGSTQSLLFLDPNLKKITSYMAPLVKSLEQIGYKEGETLFGAPYDFRYGLAPQDHPHSVGSTFLKDLKTLIEKASHSNGDTPVILVSHSLGGLFALNLLNRNTPSWRQKYVRHFVAVAAPWGGAVDEMLTFASGTTLGIPIVDPLLVRAEQRSSESNLWLMPNPAVFNAGEPLVVDARGGGGGGGKSYTADDVAEFLGDIGCPERVGPYTTRVVPMMAAVAAAPGVPVTCVVGRGVETAERLVYKGEGGFDERPEIIYGDGDGTVNMVSLLAAERLWRDEVREGKQSLKVVEVRGVSHTGLLSDVVALREIVGEVIRVNSNNSINSIHLDGLRGFV